MMARRTVPPKPLSAFCVAGWILLGVAFCQVLLFGLGLSRKLVAKPQVSVIEVPVAAKSLSPPLASLTRSVSRNASLSPQEKRPFVIPELPNLPPLPAGLRSAQGEARSSPTDTFRFDPPIEDPLAERLLKDALNTRILGDMRATALKLDEVLQKDPQNAHALSLFAELYEAMGIFDKALLHYEKVFSLGSLQAGPLYKKAALKLQYGFGTTTKEERLLAIGIVNQFKDTRVETGERITLTIPVLASPREPIDPGQVEVTVSFYDRVDGQVVPARPSNKAECRWKDAEVNWLRNGEEVLFADYYLPAMSAEDDLGPRRYYGFSIELNYQGEYVDQYAWPRILARQIESHPDTDFLSFPFDDSELGINPDNMLLPILDTQ